MKYIKLLGVELEGGWKSPPSNMKSDGSLSSIAGHTIGEVISPPMSLEDIKPWIVNNRPDKVNLTCGLHIHASFINVEEYIRLMEREFYDYFLKHMEDWGNLMGFPKDHAFWTRLEGKNEFCRRDWRPEIQSATTNASRYTHLNFCYTKHGTIECRLFPGFNNSDNIISAVDTLVDCYETWLEEHSSNLNKVFEDEYLFIE